MAQDKNTKNYPAPDRLNKLRDEFLDLKISGFIVPRTDEHQGEYVAPYSERLAWLTGFTGSAGFAIVLEKKAAIFVDGRYTLQAELEVPAILFDHRTLSKNSYTDWISKNTKPGMILGYDPWLMTPSQIINYRVACKKSMVSLKPIHKNPIDTIWIDRPAPPSSPIFIHDISFAGQPIMNKFQQISDELKKEKIDAVVITTPDSIAWLLNIRGSDVPFTPITLAFAIFYVDQNIDLFVDQKKISPAILKHLGPNVRCHEPKAFSSILDTLDKKSVLLDQETVPIYVHHRLEATGANIKAGPDPCQLPKAIKTSIQLDGIRAAHIRDGASLTRFLAWLDENADKESITENSAAKTLEAMRLNNKNFKGLSFPTISGSGPNGAIVHYSVNKNSDRLLKKGDLYLVDSGAQYLDGTTDVTRTVAIGIPTKNMMRHFTLVLKGHIAIATARFPKGTCGSQLDTLARQALWTEGLDYEHGTGHGVGHFLGVHEGPHRISKSPNNVILKPGMIISNEPGYYKAGCYGIRIENLVCVMTGTSLHFETLTLAPIDRALINIELLEKSEIDWINSYHAKVLDKISPLVDKKTQTWLLKATVNL